MLISLIQVIPPIIIRRIRVIRISCCRKKEPRKSDKKLPGLIVFVLCVGLQRQCDAQADVTRIGSRESVVAVGYTASPEGLVPATATGNAVRSCRGTLGVGLGFISIKIVPIVDPFFHVAAHVIETQLVGGFGTHWVSLVVGSALIPSHLADLITA